MVNLEAADAVIFLVDQDAFDFDEIGARSEFVFDTRNAMPDETEATVVTLGALVETTGDKQRSVRSSVSID